MSSNKLHLIAASCLGIAGCLAAVWAVAGRPAHSRIEVAPAMLTLTSEGGEPVEGRIQIRNVGNADLQVFSVESDCSCAVLEWPKFVSPRAAQDVRLKIKPPNVGDRAVKIVITSNALNEPITTVRAQVRRSIKPPYALGVPEGAISLGNFRELPKEPILHAFLTYENAGSPHWIREVVCEGGMFTATMADVTEKPTHDPRVIRREYAFSILINQEVPVGNMYGVIRVMSDEREEAQVSVVGQRLAAVFVAPRYLSAFINDATRDLPSWHVFLSAPKGFELETSVEIPESMDGLLSSTQLDERRWDFRLTRLPSEDMRSRIVFRTNHPESPEIPVDVMILLRRTLGSTNPHNNDGSKNSTTTPND